MKNYLNSFYAEFDYPSDARVALNEGYDKIYSSPKSAEIFDGIIAGYAESHTLTFSGMKEGLDLASELSGVHIYTVHLLIHICLSKELRAWYAENNLDDALWVGAMSDLKWKLLESNIVKHVWGTFVADGNWFSRWYDLSRFAFCRLQFEIIPFNREYEKNGLKLDFVEKVFDIPFSRSPKSKDNLKAEKMLS